MGDKTWWYEGCPHCKKHTLECYEHISSNIKSEVCDECGYKVPYIVDDTNGVITITKCEPVVPN